MASYFVFLVVLLLSVVYGVGDHRARARTWYFDVIIVWIFCHTAKLFSNVVMVAIGRLNLNKLRFFYDFVMVIIFQVSAQQLHLLARLQIVAKLITLDIFPKQPGFFTSSLPF